ncbi:MAG: hypothetical protein H6622_00675 [Halobacteriovoraceae bacterium]|nr:hypothetical protein [Halobacteriovoraceae bacterium]
MIRRLILFFTFTFSAFAQSVYIEPVRSKGVTPEDVDVMYSIFKQSLEDNGAVVKNDYNEADFQITLSIYKIGESYLLKAKKKKDGQEVKSGSAKIKKLDEADKGLLRIAKSVLKGESGPAVGEVLKEEEDVLNKTRKSKTSTYYALAPTWFDNLWQGDDGIGYGFTGGKQWLVRKNAALWLNLELAFNSNAFYIAPVIEGSYYFSDSDISPHIGASFGYAAAKGDSTKGDFF